MKTAGIFTLTVCFFLITNVIAETRTVTNIGYAFNPDTIYVNPDDNINFVLDIYHNAVEVAKEVYDTNGTEGNNGFNLPYGGGTISLDSTGTYYYVCQPHAHLGMKGIIIVTNDVITFNPVLHNINNYRLYPNPAYDILNIQLNNGPNSDVTIELIDLTGKIIKHIEFKGEILSNFVTTIDVSGLHPSLYFLKILKGNTEITKKVTVSNN